MNKYIKFENKEEYNRFFSLINILYGKMYKRNKVILEKQDFDINFKDIIDLGITSNAISLIKSIFFDNFFSVSTLLSLRNIIEYFALEKLYEKSGKKELIEKLIKLNGFHDDNELYSNLNKEEFNEIIDFEKLSADNKFLNEFYKENGISNKKYKTKIPFIMNGFKYMDIIKNYLNDYVEYYRLLSFYIHPHYYKIEEEYMCVQQILMFVIIKLCERYDHINSNNTYIDYFKEFNNNNINKQFLSIVIKQINIINNINKMYKQDDSFICNMSKAICEILHDISTDHLFGFSEICKIKFKAVIEVFCTFTYIYKKSLTEPYLIKFTYLFTKYQELDIINNDLTNDNKKKYLEESFKIVKKKYDITIEDLKKINKVFFTIYENEENKNLITKTYREFIKNNIEKIVGDYKIPNKTIYLKDFILLLYDESQQMSHGNGYLYTCNEGTWNDDLNIIVFTDMFINYMIELMLKTYILYDSLNEKGNEKNKEMIKVLKESNKDMNSLIKQKDKILKIKRIEID